MAGPSDPSGAIIFVSGDGPPDPPSNSTDVALFAVNGQLAAINGDGNTFPVGGAFLQLKFSGACPAGDNYSLADTGSGTAPEQSSGQGYPFYLGLGNYAIYGFSVSAPECDYDSGTFTMNVFVNDVAPRPGLQGSETVVPQFNSFYPPAPIENNDLIEFRVEPSGPTTGSCLVYAMVLIGPAPAQVPQ